MKKPAYARRVMPQERQIEMSKMNSENSIRMYLDAVRKQGRLYAPLESIPTEVRDILVGREDPLFYRHKGILPRAMLGAVRYSIKTRKPMPGGSTITQQLVKNLYLSSERSVLRKIREAAIALRIEGQQLLTKDEILELYLNCVRYGPDIYGIADAADFYFGKTPDKLTRNQAVMLSTVAISPFWRRPIEAPFEYMVARNESFYELVAVRALTALEAKSLAHIYNPRRGIDPEIQTFQKIYGISEEEKTPDGLVEYARAQLGAPYWQDAYGQTATLGLLNNMSWKHPGVIKKEEYLGDLGRKVFDDAGLIKGYLWSSSIDARPRYDHERNWTAAEIYANSKTKGRVEGCNTLKNGTLLYRGESEDKIDHIGVYSEKGMVYHAKDREHGVVAEPFIKEDWSYWSDLPEYTADPFPEVQAVTDSSPLAIYAALGPNHSGPRTGAITKITPHYMANDLSIEECGAVFAAESNKASTNYGIDSAGRIGIFVEECNCSWASASPDNDNAAITIECANLPDGSLTDACWSALVDLCADICKRHGIKDCSYTGDSSGVLTMHRWFMQTECPGPWLSEQFDRLSQEVNSKLEK